VDYDGGVCAGGALIQVIYLRSRGPLPVRDYPPHKGNGDTPKWRKLGRAAQLVLRLNMSSIAHQHAKRHGKRGI